MRTILLSAALVWGLAGCGRGESEARRDTLSELQRDSVIGQSQLPGAQGVRGALRAMDSAQSRRDREGAEGE
jgi:hypothetical protein